MAINRPSITEDKALNAWLYEIGLEIPRIAEIEARFDQLLQDIQAATDLDDLKAKVKDL